MFQLKITNDINGETSNIPMPQGDFILNIGRSSDMDICLKEPMISRRHACIISHDGICLIRNFSEKLGTKINNTPVTQDQPFSIGDKVELGPFTLEIENTDESGDLASTPETPPAFPEIPIPIKEEKTLCLSQQPEVPVMDSATEQLPPKLKFKTFSTKQAPADKPLPADIPEPASNPPIQLSLFKKTLPEEVKTEPMPQEEISSVNIPTQVRQKVVLQGKLDALDALYTAEGVKVMKQILTAVENNLSMRNSNPLLSIDGEKRSQIINQIDSTLSQMNGYLTDNQKSFKATLKEVLLDELLDLGPIAVLCRLDEVNEIQVNGINDIFVKTDSALIKTAVSFGDEAHLNKIVQRLAHQLNERLDGSTPLLEGILPNGYQVTIVLAPLSINGSTILIHKPRKSVSSLSELVRHNCLSDKMAAFLEAAVKARQNIWVVGDRNVDKTSLMNALANCIPENERVISVEKMPELSLSRANLIRLKAYIATNESQKSVTVQELVRCALKLNPDRMIIGECKGAEVQDILLAMNTGSSGLLSSCQADGPQEMIAALEHMMMMTGSVLPTSAIREQILNAANIVVHLSRLANGSIRIASISELVSHDWNAIITQGIFVFNQAGIDGYDSPEGKFTATGNIPRFAEARSKTEGDFDLSLFKVE